MTQFNFKPRFLLVFINGSFGFLFIFSLSYCHEVSATKVLPLTLCKNEEPSPKEIANEDSQSRSYEHLVLPKPKKIEQTIIYQEDETKKENLGLDRKVDSSIYFATFIVVILAFMLQGIRMWLSQLRQDFFVTMKFSTELNSWDDNKRDSVKAKLDEWWSEINKRIGLINTLFGFLYCLLLVILFILAFLHFLGINFYNIFAIFFYFVAALAGVILLWGMILITRPVKCYGGVEESLRRLQRELINAKK